MTRAEWDALSERIEAAEGADRDLDAEIAVASGYAFERRNGDRTAWWYHPCGYRVGTSRFHDYPPAYTASLDAAATLVPSGWRFVGVTYIPVRRLWHCTLEAPDGGIVRGIAKTEQGARTAAALRAHQAMQMEGEG